jgi:hypothetical protein
MTRIYLVFVTAGLPVAVCCRQQALGGGIVATGSSW